MRKLTILTIIFSVLCLSCSVKQEISLNSDGSGELDAQVYMENFFLSTLKDLTDLAAPTGNGQNQLDPQYIESELQKNGYFREVTLGSAQEGEYQGSIHFQRIEDLFELAQNSTSEDIVQLKNHNGQQTLTIKINDKNFEQILNIFPLLQDQGFQYFLPDTYISYDEYLDTLEFLFEDSAQLSSYALRNTISTSSLDLIIHTDRDIIQNTGGKIIGTSTWSVQIPLLDILLHKTELFYSITY